VPLIREYRLYAEYRGWGTACDVVAQIGQRLLYEPPVEPSVAELWLYDPGEPPRLAETLRNPCVSEAFFGARGWEEDA
jgi:hypothetical protein